MQFSLTGRLRRRTTARRANRLEAGQAELRGDVDALQGRVEAWCQGFTEVFHAAGRPVPDGLRASGDYQPVLHVIEGGQR
jgi:hypothetical protein